MRRLLAIVALCAVAVSAANKYTVSVQRVNSQLPLFSKASQESNFDYSYNPAFIPASSTAPAGLLVRCQNGTGKQWTPGPSVLAYSRLTTPVDFDNIQFDFINDSSIVIQPSSSADAYGTEDPRVVYRQADGLYYLLYTAAEGVGLGDVTARLALAITQTPQNASSWQRLGPIFPQVKWSKSGALLVRDPATAQRPHLLFWGDSSIENGLQLATSVDLRNFTYNPAIWLPLRADSFDSFLVEAGPMPLPLSDGNFLFLYNSGQHGYPSPKPNWDVQYNVGFCILNGTDPTQILQRSSSPILSPVLDWEIYGLTPNVVFAEAWTPLGNDKFLMFYGAADTYVGAAIVSVKISS